MHFLSKNLVLTERNGNINIQLKINFLHYYTKQVSWKSLKKDTIFVYFLIKRRMVFAVIKCVKWNKYFKIASEIH